MHIRTDCMTMFSAVNVPYWYVSGNFAGCLDGALLVSSQTMLDIQEQSSCNATTHLCLRPDSVSESFITVMTLTFVTNHYGMGFNT